MDLYRNPPSYECDPNDDGKDWDAIREAVDAKLLDMEPNEIAKFFGWDAQTLFELASGQASQFDYIEHMGVDVAAERLGVEL